MSNAALRESDGEKLKQNLVPDALKTDSEKRVDHVDNKVDQLASYLPGQSKPRDALDSGSCNVLALDAGRGGAGTTAAAFKPAGELSATEWAKVKADQLASTLQPKEDKSTLQAARDKVTPGADGGPGIAQRVGETVAAVKDTVVNAISGERKDA